MKNFPIKRRSSKSPTGLILSIIFLEVTSLALFSIEPAPGLAKPDQSVVKPDEITIHPDLFYGPKPLQLMDAYIPKIRASDIGIVVLHGGGFFKGSRKDAREVAACRLFAKCGYPAVSIDYSLGKGRQDAWSTVPAAIGDLSTAVKYLTGRAVGVTPNESLADLKKVIVVGFSAGGTIACLAGLPACYETMGVTPAEFDGSLLGIVNFYGPTNRLLVAEKQGFFAPEQSENWAKTSAITWVDRRALPMMTLHGTADIHQYFEQSVSFDLAMKEAGARHSLELIAGAPHGFAVGSETWNSHNIEAKLLDFFVEIAGTR